MVTDQRAYNMLALIERRRRQILVHSCLYYGMDSPLISDETFDKWSHELVDLVTNNPELEAEGDLAQVFEGFDGSTGADLPYDTAHVVNKARKLLRCEEQMRKEAIK